MSINRKLLVGEFIFLFLVIALPLFLAAGTLAWPTGWAFLILFFGSLASLMLWLSRYNPALLFFIPGTALLLGSWYGLLWELLLIGLFAWRAVLEERTLRDEFQGYAAYMTQVKYRLVPYVW